MKRNSILILQSVARGGVSISVILEYQIVGSGEGRLCPNYIAGPIRAQTCIGVSDGWPNNRVRLEAWYQIRRIILSWGPRRTWSAFSRTWNLPSRRLSYIYNLCVGIRDPICPLPTTPPPPAPTTTLPPTITLLPPLTTLQPLPTTSPVQNPTSASMYYHVPVTHTHQCNSSVETTYYNYVLILK